MVSTEEIIQGCNNVIFEQTGNVINSSDNQSLQYEQMHSVVLPPEETKIAINISTLKKVRHECQKVKESKFSLAELWLGFATMFLGAFLSALMSKTPYELSLLSVLSYTICPIGGVGFGISYFYCRNNENRNITQFAERIEEYIFDPDYPEENV